MHKILNILSSIIIVITSSTVAFSKENFFNEAIKKYQDKKYEEAKFIFERNIVYNPKDAKTYLYLAKQEIIGLKLILKKQHQLQLYQQLQELDQKQDVDDQRKEEKNLETALLIDPSNEEALLMSMKVALKKSNYSKVKTLSETFVKVCNKLCNENDQIQESLKNIEPKNES